MSYLMQSNISENSAMRSRVAQAIATEAPEIEDPDLWTYEKRRRWAAAPGWDGAWEYAMASDPNADPGSNESVITDGMILSQVQSMTAGA